MSPSEPLSVPADLIGEQARQPAPGDLVFANRLITLSYQAAVFKSATAEMVYRFAPRS